MTKVLNPQLYRQLERSFGTVRVSNELERFIARPILGLENEPRLCISHSGEYYKVCCPFCNDTRFRLYINHMFGQKDGHGRRMTFMAVCYNEGCLSYPRNKQRFMELMDDTGWLECTRVREGKDVPERAREVPWPGPHRLLSKLSKQHDATSYIRSRGFNTDELARKFDISYCSQSDYSLAQNRIIIPILEHGKLKGWQARYIGELPWKDPKQKKDLPPKYFSCPNSNFRSRCIYNWESMREWETGVIVEGPTDVWRGGSMFGCIFGNSITEQQFKRLVTVFRTHTLILCLDPEEFESRATRRRVQDFMQRMPGHFCAVKLPEGTDPGSLGREFLKEYIRDEAAKEGVKVSYRRRESR